MDIWSIAMQCAAVVFCLGGTWITGNKHVTGPALSAIGAAVFVALNVYTNLWIVATLSALTVVLNLRNVMKWSRNT
jgi:hypothetical protein